MSKKKEEENKTITPSQYFDYIKNAKNGITTEELKNSYGTFIQLAEKYNKLGQTESLKKLCFLADTLVKEEKLIEMGVTTFIYKDTIEDYITNVAENTVKIIELSRYTREIPDELVGTIEKTKPLFDEFYVLFTDYTGREERKVDKERRDKDPILFGVFKNSSTVADRFYFLGDWVDEYCDLTLDKMVEEYTKAKGESPEINSEIPKTSEELVEKLKTYKINEKKPQLTINSINQDLTLALNGYEISNKADDKKSFFKKVRSIFSKK